MQRTIEKRAVCPKCGGIQFKQEVSYELYQFIDEYGNITDEDSATWDKSVSGEILCGKCYRDCSDLFGEEIDNSLIEVLQV